MVVPAGLVVEPSILFGNDYGLIKMEGRWRENDGTLSVKAKIAFNAIVVRRIIDRI